MKQREINYTVNTDPSLLNDLHAITPELSRKLEHYHKLALQGKASNVPKLLDAIEKYPKNPQLKNFLSVLYSEMNETEKAFETNKWIIAEHPDYLFGKLNLANEYYLREEYEKMPEVMGVDMEIQALYPHRDTFHLNEVLSFYKSAVLYFCGIEELDQAEIRCDIMKELDPDAEDTHIASELLFRARMQAAQKRFEEEQQRNISVETTKQEIFDITEAPKFNHEEIEWLYSFGLYIGEEKINALLSLPRKTLIEDLESVLEDSIKRFGYFNELLERKGWDEEKMNFPLHAIFLLGELKASESIDRVFEVLSQSTDYMELYFGDSITLFWEPLFKMTSNDLEICKTFVLTPGVSTYVRSSVNDMLEQIAWHQPERREEVLLWYDNVAHFLINSTLEDNIIDSEMIGLMICNIIDLGGKELTPTIEELFDYGIVALGVCGGWEQVELALHRPLNPNRKREILPISERYEEITSTWYGYTRENETPTFNFEDYSSPKSTPIRVEKKIGRNEPCPCGSGKKYKKCCLN